jgi:aspartyl-tRNA(Asn)/glutamyl-tRNA(Gln) amidotransferase subunit C
MLRDDSGMIVRGDVLDKETVRRVAKVARLNLSEAEFEQYAADLEEILSAFSVLDEAPSGDEFDFNPVKIEDILREDEVGRDTDPAELRDGMRTKDDWVRGPRIS